MQTTRRSVLVSSLSLAVAVASAPDRAEGTPSFTVDGSIFATDIIASGGSSTWFSLDLGSYEITDNDGFSNLPAPGPTNTVSLTDLELTSIQSTVNSTDFNYGDVEGAPPVIGFSSLPDVVGTNVEITTRVDNTTGIARRFDGTFTLQLIGTDPASEAFYNEVVQLNPADPGKFVFTGIVTGTDPATPPPVDPTEFFTISTATPVVTAQTVGANETVDATLLGGQGEAGGLNITLSAGNDGGALSAAFDGDVTTSALTGTYGITQGELDALGLRFESGQVWDIEFGGDVLTGSDIDITFSYDDDVFDAGFDETTLAIAHQIAPGIVERAQILALDPIANTITIRINSLSSMALTTIVPEPSTALLLSVGLAGLAAGRRRLH